MWYLVQCDLSIVNGCENVSRVFGDESGVRKQWPDNAGLSGDLKDLAIHHQSIRKHLKGFKQQ